MNDNTTQGAAEDGAWAWQRSFRALWVVSATNYFAGWALRLALPLFMVQLTHSPLLVSGLAFTLTAPWLIVGLSAGALVDRWNRRDVLRWVAGLRIVALAALLIAALGGQAMVFWLYGIALVLGVSETFSETAAAALLPMVVPSEHLDRTNAKLTGAQMVIELLALPLGGLLASHGLVLTAGVGCACYCVGLLALTQVRGDFRLVHPPRRHLIADVREGVRFLWHHEALWTIAIIAAVINGCWGAWLAVLPLYAVAPGPMGMTEFGYSLMLAGSSLGGAIGTTLTLRVQQTLGRRWAIGINIIGNAVMFVAPALTINPWLVGAAAVLGGIGGPMWAITTMSLVQRIVPAGLQGRVSAGNRFLAYGGLALGPALAGVVAQGAGIPTVFVCGALLTALMLIPFARHLTAQTMQVQQAT